MTAVLVALVVVPVRVRLEPAQIELVVGDMATAITRTVTEHVAVWPAGSSRPPRAVAVMVAEPE